MKPGSSVTPLFLLAAVVLGLVAFASGKSAQSNPHAGEPQRMYESGDFASAVSLFEANRTLPFPPADLAAVARAYYCQADFTMAMELFSRPALSAWDIPELRAWVASISPGYTEAVSRIESAESVIGTGTAKVLKLVAMVQAGMAEEAAEQTRELAVDDIPAQLLPLYSYMRATAFHKQNLLRSSFDTLNQLLTSQPDYLPAIELRIQVAIKGGIPQDSIADLDKAEMLGAPRFFVALHRALAYKALGQLAQAEEQFTVALSIDSKHGLSYMERGNCRRFLDKKAQAREDYLAAYNNDPTLAPALVNLAILTYEAGEFQSARQLFSEAVESHPTFASAWIERGNFYNLMRLIEEAEADYLKGAQMLPEDPYPMFMAARLMVEDSQFDKAEEYANQALARNPDHDLTYVVLGDIARAKGNMEEAAQQYRMAIQLNPSSFDASRNLAAVMLDMRDGKGALAPLSRALAISPADHHTRYLLGLANLINRELDSAESAFLGILQEDEGYAAAYYGLGLAGFSRGELSSAANYLETAIRWKPEPDYVWLRGALGLVSPDHRLGNEQETVSVLFSSYEKHLFDLIAACLEKDMEKVRALVEKITEVEPEDMRLGTLLAGQLDSTRFITRPPERNIRKRSITAFYIALVYYARGKEAECKNLLQVVAASNDYLTHEYHLARVLFNRLSTGR